MDDRPLVSGSRHATARRWTRRSTAGALALCAAAVVAPVAAQTLPAPDAGLDNQLAPALDPNAPLATGTGARPTSRADAYGTVLVPTPNQANGSDAQGAAPDKKITLRATANPAVPQPRQGAPTLPPLEAYARSLKPRVGTVDPAAVGSIPLSPPPIFGPTVAALPAPTPLRHARPDADPFAPVGYSLGSLRLTPYVEQSLGYDSNPDQAATGVKGSGFSRTEGGFDLLSLWSSNQLKATMHAGYDEFFSNPSANRPDANGVVDYRLDATRTITLDAEGRFAVTTQRPGSPDVNAAVTDRPLVTSYGTTVGGSDTLGRLTLGLHGLFDRATYANGRLANGTAVILDDQNYNDFGLVARADYELLPTMKPFVQLTVDTRVHDRTIDVSGYRRDSDGIVGQIGSTFEITHLLTGSISGGYEDRKYDDPRLRDLRGPVIDASLSYAVTPLTTVGFSADTSFNETTVVGSAGSESRSFSLQLSHQLLRNLTLSAVVGYLNTDYIGSSIVENTYSGTLKASYNVSRSVVLEASYNHQTLKSTDASSSYDEDVFLVGMRLQH